MATNGLPKVPGTPGMLGQTHWLGIPRTSKFPGTPLMLGHKYQLGIRTILTLPRSVVHVLRLDMAGVTPWMLTQKYWLRIHTSFYGPWNTWAWYYNYPRIFQGPWNS